MFSLFQRTSQNKIGQLFKNDFDVIDSSLVNKERTLYRNDNFVSLWANHALIQDKYEIYFEIIYSRKKLYSFIIFHSKSKNLTEQYYDNFSIVLNNLSDYISIVKATAFEQLKSIMNGLKINPKWTSTHIAVFAGFELYFKESKDLVYKHINSQIDDDRYTPLHLAINQHSVSIVRLLLEFNPDLNLLDSKMHSVLHWAALSSFEIFRLILYLPEMSNRIGWKNHQGSTAMHLACFAKKYNIVFEFLKFGLTVRQLTLPPPRLNYSRKVNNTKNKEKNKETSFQAKQNTTKINTKISDQIVQFTEQDLCDIDCQDIELAGSPLHWVLHRRLMEKLISYKFRLNIPNIIGDTPLHVMTKRKRLRCVLTLLCAGANINAKNKLGNTALHHAVKIEDITITQALIVFDADIDAINKIGESVRHLTSKDSEYSKIILYIISSVGAKRCRKEMINCGQGCSFNGNFEGKCPALLEINDTSESFFQYLKNKFLFEQDMQRIPTEEELKNRVNLLSLDGGGIKGLIIIQVLIEFQKFLNRPIADYFQWIVGTSTGSYVATYLTIGKTLAQIRSIYFQFKDKVFVGDRPYDAMTLEKFNQDIVGPDLKMEDLKTKYNKNVLIPAVLFDRIPMKLHMFRSFASYYELLNLPTEDPGFPRQPSRDQDVWKACRASGAAPTYFKSFGPFIDGGLMSNNPTLDALTEFEFLNCALTHLGRKHECKKLGFVLSLGTGKQQVEKYKSVDISAFSLSLMELNNQIRYAYQMGNLLLNEVCNTDNHVVRRAEAFCSSINTIYFRVNPLLNKLIELDETLDFKIVNLLWETKRYMFLRRFEVARICEYLKKFTYFPEEPEKSIQNELIKSSSLEDQAILVEPSFKIKKINPKSNQSKSLNKTNKKSEKTESISLNKNVKSFSLSKKFNKTKLI